MTARPIVSLTAARLPTALDPNTPQRKEYSMLVCMRELLKAVRTYYVRTDGNDNNTGLTNDAAGAFLTIQKAIDVVYDTLDLGGFNVTIQIGDGTYTAGANVTGPQTGRGTIAIQGNPTTPANVLISTTAANAIAINGRATLNIRDLELRTTSSGVGLAVLMASTCYFQNIRFGACATSHLQVSTGALVVPGNYTISGSAPFHVQITHGGSLYVIGITVTLTGTPNWSSAFAHLELCGTFRAQTITFSGSATGARYFVENNSVVQTYGAGPNYFPGNAAGQVATGGQYT
jgi:hypothetical protein